MGHPRLDKFGKKIMTEIRDESITDWQMILDGRMKGERAEELRKKISVSSNYSSETFLLLLPEIVDTVLFHTLRMFDEDKEFKITCNNNGEQIEDLAEESDGFMGELFTEDGWIARYSNE